MKHKFDPAKLPSYQELPIDQELEFIKRERGGDVEGDTNGGAKYMNIPKKSDGVNRI